MKKYEIEIKEILSRVIEIEAESEKEALDKAQFAYANEEIVLDYNDFMDYNIEVVKEVK